MGRRCRKAADEVEAQESPGAHHVLEVLHVLLEGLPPLRRKPVVDVLDLVHQLRTYSLMQERGLRKREASAETGYGLNRDYGIGAQILHDLGLRRIVLLTNHPPKVAALEGFELEVVGNVYLGQPAHLSDQKMDEEGVKG